MSESAPQQPVDYLQEHPAAIEDQAKAEIMAYASHGQEEVLVAERAKAIDAASNIGNSNFRGEGNRGASHAASHHAEQAKNARENANVQAMGAAAIYDQVKGL
jgi:hypothetical protein